MNVYQLMPTSYYDEDDIESSEFWSRKTLGTTKDGQASRSGFYVDCPVMADSASEEVSWYSVVTRDDDDDHMDCVSLVPRLLPLDDRRQLRFYDDVDDSDSSVDNETHFGRILDTISEEEDEEEEDDDDDVKVAATDDEIDARQRQHSLYKDSRFVDLSKVGKSFQFIISVVINTTANL